MTHTSAKVLLLALTLLLTVSANAADRRKNRGLHNSGATFMVTEPDAMPARMERDTHCARPTGAVINKGNINTKHREGIDVSHYQGVIDWEKVAGSDRISYAYLKATEGATYVDRTYERNLSEARRVGLSVGSYHFYRPNIDWRVQVENLTTNVKKEEQDLVPIIDIETRGRVSHEKFISDLRNFIKAVTKFYGKKPLLYTYHNFYNDHLIGCFKGYHWMIARYRDDQPTLDDGTDYIMWQYTCKGSIPGVNGDVDRSRIMNGFRLEQVQM